MRTGVPPRSKNCLDAAGFLPFVSEAVDMRVPRPAAGMMTTTFIAACKYKRWEETVQMSQTALSLSCCNGLNCCREEEMDWKANSANFVVWSGRDRCSVVFGSLSAKFSIGANKM